MGLVTNRNFFSFIKQLHHFVITNALLVLTSWACYTNPALAVADVHDIPKYQASAQQVEEVTNRLIIKRRAGLDDIEFAKILKPYQTRILKRIEKLDMHVVELPSHINSKWLAKILKNHPHIKFAQPDKKFTVNYIPNDSYYPQQWHLPIVRAPLAWDLARGEGIIIAVLDTGVNANHPDLVGQVVSGWNMVDGNADTADVQGHGTLVSGVIVATTGDAAGVASIAPRAKVVPVRIAYPNGTAYLSTIVAGINWAADYGARVINISFGPLAGEPSVHAAAQYAQSKGSLVIVSAGNAGIQENAVQSSTLIAVSATNPSDATTSWSSYGSYVDLSAPGENIMTTHRDGGHVFASGTSFSSPLVAGIAALALSANPNLQPSQLSDVLTSTAKDLGTPGYDIYFGYGRVDARRAVESAVNLLPRDTQAPTVAITSPSGGIVSGTINVDINASDNVGVTRVDFYAKGVLVASDTAAPYQFSWNSASVPDGTVELDGFAYDAAGNVTSSGVWVTVKNVTSTSSRINVALAANGGVASASSTFSAAFPASSAINGDRKGLNWGNGGGWRDLTQGVYPDYLQVNFSGDRTINEIDVFTLQDNSSAPFAPTLTMAFSQYGITDFNVEYWNGNSWNIIPGGAVVGNNKVWRKFTFPNITTSAIRVLINNSLGGSAKYSRITEVEAWGY